MRALGGVLHRRFSADAIAPSSLTLAIVAGPTISSSAVAPIGYPVLGMIRASIFPMGLTWISLVAPHDSDGTSLLNLFNLTGGILGPGAVDPLVAHQGVRVGPLANVTLACIDLVIFAGAVHFRRASSDPHTRQP